ncbi:protein NKG7 [Petaurus breviceps papuanus]|uniref:protein NKG7 n=1 Tax=Petaurus breviceps papuanus TaxID=3040969 RepID=UPI0036DD7015
MPFFTSLICLTIGSTELLAFIFFRLLLTQLNFLLREFSMWLNWPAYMLLLSSVVYFVAALIKVVQALMAIAIVTGFLAFVDVFLILLNVANDRTFFYLASALCSFVTALLGLVGQSIFMVSIQMTSIHNINHFFFEWVFYLGWGTSTLYLLSDFIQATRVFTILAALAGLLSISCLILFITPCLSNYGFRYRASLSFCITAFVAALCSTVGMAVYTGEQWKKSDHVQVQTTFAWSFYMGWISVLLFLFTGVLSLVVHRDAPSPNYEAL